MTVAQESRLYYHYDRPVRAAARETRTKWMLAAALFCIFAGNIPLTADGDASSGSTAIIRGAGLGAGLALLLIVMARQKRNSITRVLIWLLPFITFMCFCALSAAWSLDPKATIIRSSETLVTIIFTAFWTQAISRISNSDKDVCTWIAVAILALAAYGIFVNTVFFGTPLRIVINEELDRARLVFGSLHPLAVGDMLAIGAIATVISNLRWIWKILALATLLPLLQLTDATGSRILVAGAFVAYAGYSTIRLAGFARSLVLLPIFAIVVGLSVALLLALDLPLTQKITDNQRIMTLTGRTQLWAVIWQAGLASTWFGTGFDAARGAILEIFGIAYQTHNQYLAILVETGYVGLILFIPVFVTWLLSIIRSRNFVVYCFGVYILAINVDHASMLTKTWLIFLTIFCYVTALRIIFAEPQWRATPSRHATFANIRTRSVPAFARRAQL